MKSSLHSMSRAGPGGGEIQVSSPFDSRMWLNIDNLGMPKYKEGTVMNPLVTPRSCQANRAFVLVLTFLCIGLSEVGTSAASSPASSIVPSFSQLSVSAAGPLLKGLPAVAAAGGEAAGSVARAAITVAAAGEAGGSACGSTGSPQLLKTGKGSPMPVVTVTGSEEHVVHLHPENAALWERIQQQQQSPPRSGAGMRRGSLPIPPPPPQQARSGSRRGSPVLVQKEQHQQVGEGAFMRAWSPLSPHSAAGGTQQQGASGLGMPRGSPLARQHQHQQSRPGSSRASPLQIRPVTSHVPLGASASAAAVSHLMPLQERAHSLEYILPPSAGLYQQQQEQGRQNVVQLQRQGSSPLVGFQPPDQQHQQQLLLPPLQHQEAQQVMQLPVAQPSSSLLLMPQGGLYELPQQPVAYIQQQQQQQELLPAMPVLSSGIAAAAGSSGGWLHTGAVQSEQPRVPLGFDAAASGCLLIGGDMSDVYGVPAMSQSPASLALSGGYVVVHEEPAGQGAFMSLSLSPDQSLEQQQQQQGLGYMSVMQGQSLPLATGPQQLLALLEPPQLQQQQLDQEHAVRMSLAVTQYLAIQAQHGQQLQILSQPEEIFYYHQQH